MQVGYDVGTFQYLFMVHFHSLYGFILDKDNGVTSFRVQHRAANLARMIWINSRLTCILPSVKR